MISVRMSKNIIVISEGSVILNREVYLYGESYDVMLGLIESLRPKYASYLFGVEEEIGNIRVRNYDRLLKIDVKTEDEEYMILISGYGIKENEEIKGVFIGMFNENIKLIKKRNKIVPRSGVESLFV